MAALCIPIFIKSGMDIEESIASAEEALESTDGMLELRCDTASPKQLTEALDLARLPVIVTVRPTWEGGFSEKMDAQRIALWEQAVEAGADYIDVELLTWEKSRVLRDSIGDIADKAGTRLILSNHCFDGRPADLQQRLARLRAVKEAHILKLAWQAQSIRDALDALEMSRTATKQDGRPMVALAMGEEGLLSRLLAKKCHAPFTFASASTGKESAPGQPTVAQLRTLYRWDKHTPDMPIFGVAGWPIAHSLSPHIHNAGLDALNLPEVYVPLAIRPDYDSFADTIDTLRKTLDLQGLSVTIPHKENAFRYVTQRGGSFDQLSKHIGVINTLGWRNAPPQPRSLYGLNSDYAGALDALATAYSGQRSDIAGKRIAVLGAGGAARAIVAGLAANGATVVIYNRTLDKAEKLAAEFTGPSGKVVATPWDTLPDSTCHAFINCTPLGMHPNVDTSPFDDSPPPFTKDTIVFDTVYNPLITQFLRQAQSQGAKIIPGSEMFVRQAAIQFKEFTGKIAPIDLFRQVLLESLKK